MSNNLVLTEALEFFEPTEFQPIDTWVPNPEDEVFKTVRGAVMLDVSSFYGMEPNNQLDAFVMSAKRSYNNPDMREHTVHYLNYFEKFYDKDHELPTIYCKLKYLIDYEPAYTKEAFFYDLNRYIFHGSIFLKIGFMNLDNYSLNLTYKNLKNPNLQYSDWETVTSIWKHRETNSLNCWETVRLICYGSRQLFKRQASKEMKVRKK